MADLGPGHPRRPLRAQRHDDVARPDATQRASDPDRLGRRRRGGQAQGQPSLRLVDHQDVDARQRCRVGCARGRQVEQDPRAKGMSPLDGRRVGRGGNLGLEDDDVGGGGEQRGLGGLGGHSRVRPRVQDDRVLAGGGHGDQRRPRWAINRAQVGDVHPVRGELIA